MDEQKRKKTEWKWRYTFWTGIMYGPIPVGIIIFITFLICYVVYKVLATE